MAEKNPGDHRWAPWAHCDPLTMGRLVFDQQYYDSEGVQCVKCMEIVQYWIEKYRKEEGKIVRKQTGKTAPKSGCPGWFKIEIFTA